MTNVVFFLHVILTFSMISPQNLGTPLSSDELLRLEDFLVSSRTSDNAMSIDMLDGYLTAVAVGPDTLLPDQWLPYVWGLEDDAPPEFASEDEAGEIMGLLLRHMNSIVRLFIENPDSFLPLYERCSFEEESDRDLAAESWAYAFAMGIELSRESWRPLFDDDEAYGLLLPIFIVGGIGDEWDRIGDDETGEWRDALPEAVVGIYEYWVARQAEDGE
ncbi:YecA family protein [Prosthecochloris sp. ZM_2]|nr:YecA family protein [Prosthecochloris sp. ZM_2]